MPKHHIYWWNLENLFDVEDSIRRSEFLNETLKKELKGWTEAVLEHKLENLVSIIRQLNGGSGPDLLGVCEVENGFVLGQLIGKMNAALNREYNFVITDSEDKRGIDTALIYDSNKYSHEPETFDLRIIKRNSTRDLFQIHLKTANNNKLIIVLNHWPSRTSGQLKTEPYRIMVAENLAYWIERIHEEQGDDASVLLMGDFNDNPNDRSLTEYLLSTNNKAQVKSKRVKKKYMYNLMHKFLDAQIGTYVYNAQLNILDQFIVSRSILSHQSALPFKISKVEIVNLPELIKGAYSTPVKFSRPSKKTFNENGFSDHLPIELVLNEKE